MRCATCKKDIVGDGISAARRDFCSDVCHLHFWKEEMPNLGGRWISDENIQKLEQLHGQQREEFYNKIVNSILDNFDDTYFMLMLRYGAPDREEAAVVDMTDEIFQKKFDQARNFKKEGKFVEAMRLYSELYKQLIRDAFKNVGGATESYSGDEARVGEYFKKDNLACTILNNMGAILAEVGNKEAAKKYFEESVKYTPEGLGYQNPKIGLKELDK